MTYTRSYHHDLDPQHECGEGDIANIILEIDNLRRDTSLARYENPSEAEMREILDRARIYTGSWYHSDVLFDMDGDMANPGESYVSLREKIRALPVSQGVNVVTRYADVPGLGSLFE